MGTPEVNSDDAMDTLRGQSANWPESLRTMLNGSGDVPESLADEIARGLNGQQRSEYVRAWNLYVVATARERYQHFMEYVALPKKTSISDLGWIVAIRLTVFVLAVASVPVGYMLSGWIGVGVGICIALLSGLTYAVMDLKDEFEAWSSRETFERKKYEAMRARNQVLGFELLGSGRFRRDLYPWSCPSAVSQSQFVLVRDE